MQHPFFLFGLLISSFSCFSQEDYRNYSLKNQELEGRVKTVEHQTHQAEADSLGNPVIRYANLHSRNNGRRLLHYTEAGRLLDFKWTSVNDMSTLHRCYVYEDTLLKSVRYSQKNVAITFDQERKAYTYSKSEPVREILYATAVCVYDKNNRLLKVTESDTAGKPVSEERFSYDKHGRTLSIKSRKWEDGQPDGENKTTYFYDTAGHLIRSDQAIGRSLSERIAITYEDGSKTTETWEEFYGDEPVEKEIRFYESGLLKKVEFYSYGLLQDTTTYTYELDPSGNWIKRIGSVNGRIDSVSERTIVYY